MKKRTFLKTLLASGGFFLARGRRAGEPDHSAVEQGSVASRHAADKASTVPLLQETSAQEELVLVQQAQNELHPAFVHQEHHAPTSLGDMDEQSRARLENIVEQLPDTTVDDYLKKIRNFDADFATDIYLDERSALQLVPVVARLERVQNYVGHANFNLLSFAEMRYFARNYPAIGAFEKAELDFLEEIFHADASSYGFFGEKVTPDLDQRILQKDVVQIPGTGHYLLQGESYQHFKQISNDVGEQLQLTSGLRNNVKQMHLFLAKTRQSHGNLSKASRSLAPPGYSFHNIGDFDVGKKGLGGQNFTSDFSKTEEFRRLSRLGYVKIRYTDDNHFGVRFEPWHIKLG
ncbi:MAG TPA: peptidase M15 [Pseudomonadaceae bacterium]|nr:peptidase M15 [Pseudomonadaceae bacterium]